MPTIGTKVLNTAADMLRAHLMDYARHIDTAYLEADDQLSISMGIKLAPGPAGTDISTSITFVTGKIKDIGSAQVDENQQDLPGMV